MYVKFDWPRSPPTKKHKIWQIKKQVTSTASFLPLKFSRMDPAILNASEITKWNKKLKF